MPDASAGGILGGLFLGSLLMIGVIFMFEETRIKMWVFGISLIFMTFITGMVIVGR